MRSGTSSWSEIARASYLEAGACLDRRSFRIPFLLVLERYVRIELSIELSMANVFRASNLALALKILVALALSSLFQIAAARYVSLSVRTIQCFLFALFLVLVVRGRSTRCAGVVGLGMTYHAVGARRAHDTTVEDVRHSLWFRLFQFTPFQCESWCQLRQGASGG